MSLEHFSVTQLRTAATCPRIHYFDTVASRENPGQPPRQTRIWMPGTRARVGGGALFHTVVERFNRKAGRDATVLSLIEQTEGDVDLARGLMRYVNENCIDLVKLAEKPVELRQALVDALFLYFEELAAMINYALSNGKDPLSIVQELFGDARRRVDVTFHFSDEDAAHVTGAIDYIYYDWRISGHRVVDYKLTPADHANRDLFQVSAYALMHHHQHETEPSAAVFYRHPTRQVVDRSWDTIKDERHKIYNLLASMVQWGRYDESSSAGLKPPGDTTWCAGCKWNKKGQCEARLGPKSEGRWSTEWRELSSLRQGEAPELEKMPLERLSAVPPEESSEEWVEEEISAAYEEEEPGAREVAGSARRAAASSADRQTSGAEARIPRAPIAEPTRTAPDHREALALNENSLRVGKLGEEEVRLPTSLLNTHVAVVGAAGSGKTWTAKVIAEEAAASGIPVLAVDPQGDLVQFLKGAEENNLPPDERERMRRVRESIEPRIYTPGTSHGIRLSLNPLRLPRKSDLERIAKPERRKEEEDAMLQAAASNLVSLANIGGEEESQRTFLYRLFQEMNREADIQLDDVVSAIKEAVGVEDADEIIKKTERNKLARRLYSFAQGPSKNLFSGGEPLDISAMQKATQPGKTPLNVIYLNALTNDEQKHFFLASLAAEIYRWMVSTLDASSGKSNLLFYIDEARDWIPAGGKSPPAKDSLIRLFTQGRKYGVGCLLCTQSPRSVDYNVFGNCSTKIIGRMEAAQDIERIRDWFTKTGAAPAWIAERKGAAKGTFVARWPDMPAHLEGRAFKGRPLYSAHEAAWSPDRVELEMDQSGR